MTNIFISSSNGGQPVALASNYPPGALRAVEVSTGSTAELTNITLHCMDLEKAGHTFNNSVSQANLEVKEALWLAAIVTYFKCFQRSASRRKLKAEVVFEGKGQQILEVHNYFKALRDKNFVHDENNFTQVVAGALIYPSLPGFPSPQPLVLTSQAITSDESHYRSFGNLLTYVRGWANCHREKLHSQVRVELSSLSLSELMGRKQLQVRAPVAADVALDRT